MGLFDEGPVWLFYWLREKLTGKDRQGLDEADRWFLRELDQVTSRLQRIVDEQRDEVI